MYIYKEKYKLDKINSSEIITYIHLGIGDHIICNGLINELTNRFRYIHLPVKKPHMQNIRYLYKNNPKVKVFQIEHLSEIKDIKQYAKNNRLEVLKIGFKKRKPPFNVSFYEQLNFDYSVSYEAFKLPHEQNKEKLLTEHLMNHFGIKNNFQLVHNESSFGKTDLKINTELRPIFVNKETDIFNNIFFYKNIISLADEIHCLDSSFLHLVERVPTEGKLFFHEIKKVNHKAAKVYLTKNWKRISY